jgi:hypothetical protein
MNNLNKPAPLWFRRLETALVFLFMGAIPLIGLTKSIPESLRDDISLVLIPGLALLVKAIGIFLGEPIVEPKNNE